MRGECLLRDAAKEFNENQVLAAGFAQLPKGSTLYEVQKVIGFVMIIDKTTDIIIDASFTFIMDLTNQFISHLVRGYDIKRGTEPLIERIREQFLAPPQGAIIQAIRAAFDRYLESIHLSKAIAKI
jgi:hypothetical protein